MEVHYIFVEGNIGAGKSTYITRILPYLKRFLQNVNPESQVISVLEPLQEWTTITDATDAAVKHNLFEAYYADPKRYAMLFQTHALPSRIEAVERALAPCKEVGVSQKIYVLAERSVHADRHVFVQALAQADLLTPLEHSVYETWWKYWNARLYPGTSACVVYLGTDPKTCKTQMCKRDRAGEDGVDLDYLQQLDVLHKKAFADGTRGWTKDMPCLHVQSTANFAVDDAYARELAMQLTIFLEENQCD